MRYSREHREKQRRKIVRQAARLFRRFGYAGVGIERIMAAARLTRGGFYGYFRSKADLFAEVMRDEHEFNSRMQARRGRTPEDLNREAMAVVSGYLAPENRAGVGTGCPMASLSVDVARAPKAVRAAYTEKLKELSAEFADGLPGRAHDDPRALRSIALAVGGLILSRAVADEDFADRISAACRDGVAGELGIDDHPSEPA